MNIEYIEHETVLNGEGNRCVLWCSGCKWHCKGCQNPETWDEKSGHPFTDEDKKELIEVLKNPYIEGVTFSGGDPLFPSTREELTKLAKELKELFPNKTIWCYTGYLWEDINTLPIMKYIDVLVDGPFELSKLNVKYPWAGSTNQRVIMVKESLKKNEVVLWQEKII